MRLAPALHRAIAAALAVLFAYKAVEEAHIDPVWTLIYVLIGLEYALDAFHGYALKKPGKAGASA